MTISPGILKIFFEHKRQLIPIALDDPSKLKRPLHAQWNTRDYSHNEIREYVDTGHNLGWRMAPGEVVIDIDPRNDAEGFSGAAALLTDFQRYDSTIEDLGDVFPMVRTGGLDKGVHLYASIDPNIKIQNSILKYGKGVEFKSVGRQVIIPGSIHPDTDRAYTFDDFSDYMGPATPLPEWLVTLIRRDVSSAVPVSSSTSQHNNAELTPEELYSMLQCIPAANYSTNDEWFPLMAACHEATNGLGGEVFVNWSISDPAFAGHAHIIRHRWRSFETGKAGNVTPRTLYQAVSQHGGQLPPMVLATTPVIDSALTPLPPPVPVTPVAPIIHHTDRGKLDRDVAALTTTSSTESLEAVLDQVAGLCAMDQETYLNIIRQQTGRPMAALRKGLYDARLRHYSQGDEQSIDDQAIDVTTTLLKRKFENGSHLLHGADQAYWQYDGKRWRPLQLNLVENYLLKASNIYRLSNAHVRTGVSTLMAQGERVLRARQASEVNLNVPDKVQSVINTNNCEVWFDPDTALITTQAHTPGSHLTTLLNCDFNPRAKCPVFTKALHEMFAYDPDTEDMVRHLWELFGYIIQPNKNIATWVLFHGEGANGKTVVLNVLSALLGDAVLHKSINELDPTRNNHALADLPNKLCVIDEDLDARSLLPDSLLKKVSESKELLANPKMRPAFKFLNTAIMVFASNEYPKTKDLSNGLRRRAMVFDFNRTFAEHEQDKDLTQRIISTEMDGVLIEALKGLGRLRKRGGWLLPQSCIIAGQTWQDRANTISEFLREALVPTSHGSVEFKQVYSSYRMWCIENGYRMHSSRIGFSRGVQALGILTQRGANNRVFVMGYTLRDQELEVI